MIISHGIHEYLHDEGTGLDRLYLFRMAARGPDSPAVVVGAISTSAGWLLFVQGEDLYPDEPDLGPRTPAEWREEDPDPGHTDLLYRMLTAESGWQGDVAEEALGGHASYARRGF